ncbi:MAG: hypothetical protein HQ473_07195 [Cryomorphaceae bacterium]|nr:hypothetical protein [Cryomorphaceae bacterium]
MENSKPLSLALLLGMFTAALAQTPPRQIELNPEWKPYEWSMMPATEFFKLTGLTEADSVGYRIYRLGTDTIGSVKVQINYIIETNTDVVGYIKYENWKIKDIFKINEAAEAKYNVRYGEEDEKPDFWLGDAFVELGYMRTESNPKRGHYDLLSNPVYRFVPHPEHVINKLDSTWSQLMNNPTDRMRGIVNDSGTYRLTFENITPLIEYEVVFPSDKSEDPYAITSTIFDGGLQALKWSMKQYYTQYLDHMDDGEIWVAPSEEPKVRIAYLFNDGVLVHLTISRAEYLDWITYEEEEE